MAVTAETAALVRLREKGRCQYCRMPEWRSGLGRFVIHHIQARGSGGTSDPALDSPANLALLHDTCHREVHANPRKARERGLMVSKLGRIEPVVSLTQRQMGA